MATATETQNKIMLDWLRDAHAMEKAAEQILSRQQERVESYPDVHAKVKEHLEVTRQQATRLENLIKSHNGSTSGVKDMVSKIMGNVQAIVNAGAGDEIVKSGIGDFMFEQFEIASYRSLIQAAEQVGDDEVKRVCEQNLEEEVEMASWLEKNLPVVTADFLQRQETGQKSKR